MQKSSRYGPRWPQWPYKGPSEAGFLALDVGRFRGTLEALKNSELLATESECLKA